MHSRLTFLVPVLALTLAACSAHRPLGPAAASAPSTLADDPSHPGLAKGWVDTKLYFGLGPADHPDQGVSEADWRAFLDQEVTPRFPDGLSVLEVYGQWKAKNEASPARLRSKLLIIDYPDTAENRAKVEAIRAAWKQKTGDQSVMRVTARSEVSF